MSSENTFESENKISDIFISSAAQDDVAVSELCNILSEKHKLKLWRNKEYRMLTDQIVKEITKARLVLCFISNEYLKQIRTLNELLCGLKKAQQLFLIMLENIRTEELAKISPETLNVETFQIFIHRPHIWAGHIFKELMKKIFVEVEYNYEEPAEPVHIDVAQDKILLKWLNEWKKYRIVNCDYIIYNIKQNLIEQRKEYFIENYSKINSRVFTNLFNNSYAHAWPKIFLKKVKTPEDMQIIRKYIVHRGAYGLDYFFVFACENRDRMSSFLKHHPDLLPEPGFVVPFQLTNKDNWRTTLEEISIHY